MFLLFDTNVILDSLLERSSFAVESSNSVKNALAKGYHCLFSTSSATDLFYIIRKQTGSRTVAWERMILLSNILEFASVTGDDIMAALKSRMQDFEDAVVAATAARHSAAYIITRNIDDFRFSPVPAITPKEFNMLFAKGDSSNI